MKLLAKTVIGGAPWEIYLATAEEEPALVGKQGICVWSEQIIYINDDEVATAGIPFVVAHEIAHAAIFMCGGRDTLQHMTGFKGAKYSALEEFIVGTLFHSYYDTLIRNNWLKIKLKE